MANPRSLGPLALILLVLLLISPAQPQPSLTSFSSCLSQHSASLAPSDQLINVTQLWSQLDTGQEALGQLGGHAFQSDRDHHILRFSLLADVGSQSTGYSSQTNFLSTLITQTSVLNFVSFSNQSALCSSIRPPDSKLLTPASNSSSPANSSIVPNSGCPYGPGPIALGVSIPLNRSAYPSTTLSTQLQLLDTSTPALTLACIQIDTSPYYPSVLLYKLIKLIPIIILLTYLLITWSARIWAAILSDQLNREAQVAASLDNPLHPHLNSRFSSIWWIIWSGQGLLLSGPLLRFSTPGTRDIFIHLQFISLLGLFSVQWPEFVYPILTQLAWSTLALNSTILHIKPTSDQLSHPNPLIPPPYDPPQQFISQFDSVSSPLYLNRTLPNVLLNYNDQKQGIPRWANTIGITPRDVFPIAICVFALICVTVAFFSLLSYSIALIASFVSSRLSPSPTSHQRDSAIFNCNPTDDGLVDSPPSVKPLRDESTSQSNQERNSLVGNLSTGSSSFSPWPDISRHFALLQGNLLRLFILFYFPIVVFASYQISLYHLASILSVIIAGICLSCCAVVPALQLYRLKGRTTEQLIDQPTLVLSLGPLYNTYDDQNEMFMGVRFLSSFIVGIAIGAGQSSSIVQAVVLLVAELAETMLTSLWLPWGDGAAMAPLAFISSVSRIISAVILVVLTPAVSVGAVAAGWLTYVILLILGIVLAIYLGVLLVKLVELLLRLIAHIPFDETKSTRAGGLRGALRRWDRTSSRSLRHGRAAAIAARRHKRLRSKSNATTTTSTKKPTALAATRNSMFSVLNVQVSNSAGPSQNYHQHSSSPPTSAPGFVTMNDDDGNIMSAMSQGPWLRTPASETLFANHFTHAIYPNPSNQSTSHQQMTPELSTYPTANVTTPSSGFAVVRGGRASEKAPYLMHNDGRNTWHNSRPQPLSRANHDYPPIRKQAQMSTSPDFQIQHSGNGPSFYKAPGNHPNGSLMTTNLFESTAPFQLTNSEFQNEPSSSNRKPKNKKKDFSLLGLFQVGRSKKDGDSTSDDDWDDSDDEEEESEEEAEEGDNNRGKKKNKLKGIMAGFEGWGRKKVNNKDSEEDGEKGMEGVVNSGGGDTSTSPGFQVVRQPRPKPSSNGSASQPNSTNSNPNKISIDPARHPPSNSDISNPSPDDPESIDPTIIVENLHNLPSTNTTTTPLTQNLSSESQYSTSSTSSTDQRQLIAPHTSY